MDANEENEKTRAQGEDRGIADLRQSIRRSFTGGPYNGKVTHYDGKYNPSDETTALLDDDQALYEGLFGRGWTDVSAELLHQLPDGLALLTDEAFVAFLPAWLMQSLENIHGENEIRNFLVYTFSPRPDMVPDVTSFTARRVRVLNSQQRSTVRSLLARFAQNESSASIRRDAARAIAFIDSLE